MTELTSVAALWGAVTASGIYHGLNPGMGWPLAVSAALMHGKTSQLVIALGMLGLGHLLAMMAILLPFSFVNILIENHAAVQLGASTIVILMGLYLLWNRRHPKFLARVHPARLALWSFLAAMAHGAGLMLVPMYLGISGDAMAGAEHAHGNHMVTENLTSALGVAVVHTLAMLFAAGSIATTIYFWLGIKFLSKTWFNLDVVWALSLIIVGAIGIYSSI